MRVSGKFISGVIFLDSSASVGGSPTETFTVTGLLSTDVVLSITKKVAGANPVYVESFGAPSPNQLAVTFNSNPGAGMIIRVVVKR